MWRRRDGDGTVGKPQTAGPLDREPGVLDRGHRVTGGAAATGQQRPDRGVGESLQRSQRRGVGSALLAWQHWVVRPGDLTRLNAAFFSANAALSAWLLAAAAVDIVRGS